MKTVYMDITQLVSWAGKLTGIPRSMNELATRFTKQPNCQMILWDRRRSLFVKTDYINIDRTKAGDQTHQGVKSGLKSVIKKSRFASAATKLYSVKYVKPGLDPVNFKKDDILFITWGLWDQEPYIQALLAAKANDTKLVQIVHDMLPLVEPQFSGHSTLSLNNYATNVYPRCDLLIAVSKSTKKDTVNWLKQNNLNTTDIKVLRWGEDFIVKNPQKPEDSKFTDSHLKGKDYILCVGTIEARKNHALLYYVYKLANQNAVNLPKTVVVGRRGWLSENILEIITNDPRTKENIIILENVSDEELSWLYDHCLFSVYPSFYEGWGLPIAESLSRGVPCIASNTSSMPEIAGNLIDYFSPYSPEECLDAIKKLTKSNNLEVAVKKVANYQPTTWDMTFKSVKMYIEEI